MTHNKSYTLAELAELLSVELIGDGDCEINGLATLSSAGPGCLSFLSNPTYVNQLASCKASAIIIEEKYSQRYSGNKLISNTPYICFARATQIFSNAPVQKAGIHPSASVDSTAVLSESVSVGANAVIEANVVIGDGCVIGSGCSIGESVIMGAGCALHSNVTLYHAVTLGSNVTIHSGAVIGADGFGFAFDGDKSIKIHQLGGVDIADDVEIGAGTTIDRGALDDTIIEQGVKIDNQVQIGHNCKIGAHTIICGCAGLAGSVTIGSYCIMGGGSGAVGHITIVDKVQVSAMSLVSKSILEAGTYSSGTMHMKTSLWKRNIVRFQQLDSIAKRLKELEKSTDKQ
ncbi:MAG: UDP-3-O-(3-hydroxymyristoyl)glucosamine N-acyltransferase [SAR86 cluster bacterium]|uniref:UDP-3-O-acylglucosamine N-acyltransferase n=1 Tax=SAR86 cluster bacterium TaxID=2030880 RepID=A0A2A5B0G5_9GAMM|nr:MAG: UDP-3-O-(3-hydroxymyristoyl)glucosamine N-acyltransferase [SAR86 cluster bacterium]